MENDPLVADLREQISRLDVAILQAINERLELVERLWEHKRSRGYDMIDSQREARMLEELRAANQGRLSDDGIRSLLSAILDLTRRELSH
jgi:chorismate mutase